VNKFEIKIGIPLEDFKLLQDRWKEAESRYVEQERRLKELGEIGPSDSVVRHPAHLAAKVILERIRHAAGYRHPMDDVAGSN
jgi:hypothetical protein